MAVSRIVQIVLLLALLLTGCATRECATVCFAPVSPFQPQTGRELLARLNSRMSKPVEEDDFLCFRADGNLVAWVVLDSSSQGSRTAHAIKNSPSLQLLSVGYFPPETRNLLGRGEVK